MQSFEFSLDTLMQDTLDITGADYEYDFILLYTGYSVLVQWTNTTQVYNSGVTDERTRVQTPSDKLNAKTESPFCSYFGIQYYSGHISALMFCAFLLRNSQ